ncbi:MAG: DNA repair protein RecO [Chlamydiae bacterium]|jgi:DNA repair protein RecO (recombination protein O)|nr:DNA repair protein RecO [Chlamydiota bacterium]
MLQTKGLVLKASPFQDSGKILQVLTKDFGIISILIKSIPEKRLDLIQTSTPLYEGLFYLKKGSMDLYKLIETSPLNYHHELKENFSLLKSAVEILQLIAKTQPKNKPLPLLYELTSIYLNELRHCLNLKNLLSSFYLKFLRHEGLFNLDYFSEKTLVDREKLTLMSYALKFEAIYGIELSETEFSSIYEEFYGIMKSTV